jgi:cytochrome bd ubiquinol oxidase subunit II
MTPNTILAGLMLVSLIVYALLAGADYGAGFWDLLSFGSNRERQRDLIAHAIQPVWETNHVWLILLIVLMFAGFPAAFTAITVNLAVPLYLILCGIVSRGASFVFRAYFTGNVRVQAFWGRIFSISSSLTPLFLGIIIGAISSDAASASNGSWPGLFQGWLHPFPLTVGVLSLSLFAYLSACYLIVESRDSALQSDFRARALASCGASVLLAVFAHVMAGKSAYGIKSGLWSDPLAWLVEIGAVIATIVSAQALWSRNYRRARIAAAAQVAFILLGWGVAQFPYLVRPDITIFSAASPSPVITSLVVAVLIGAVVLVPSLALLMYVFKTEHKTGSAGTDEGEATEHY